MTAVTVSSSFFANTMRSAAWFTGFALEQNRPPQALASLDEPKRDAPSKRVTAARVREGRDIEVPWRWLHVDLPPNASACNPSRCRRDVHPWWDRGSRIESAPFTRAGRHWLPTW